MSGKGSGRGRRRGDGPASPRTEAPESWVAFAAGTCAWAARLRAASDLESALASTAAHGRQTSASLQATVRLLDPSGERLLLGRRVGPAVIGSVADAFQAREGFLGWVLEQGEVAFTNEPPADPRFQVREDQQWMPTAVVAAPLPGRGGAIGTLSAARDDGRPYDATDAARLAIVAEIAGAHLEAGRQARLAITDDLTLLPNKRHLRTVLPDAVAEARATRRPLSLVMLDLDHFSRVNNDFGHDVGDEVLRDLAARLRTACRETDLAMRWGGEEFVVLLPGTPCREATRVAERIRRALAASPVAATAGDVPLSGSFGVATLREGEQADELLHRADQAEREAKRRGRNCVVAWSPDLERRGEA